VKTLFTLNFKSVKRRTHLTERANATQYRVQTALDTKAAAINLTLILVYLAWMFVHV